MDNEILKRLSDRYYRLYYEASACSLSVLQYHVPVVVSLATPGVVSTEQPKVSVRVTSLLGQPLTADGLSVTVESATRVADDVIVLSKKKFEPTSDK